MKPDYYTTEQVAAILGTSLRMVQRLIKEQRIEAVRPYHNNGPWLVTPAALAVAAENYKSRGQAEQAKQAKIVHEQLEPPKKPAKRQLNAKFDHVFVVIRAEIAPGRAEWPIEQRITTTKAFFTKEEAEKEALRLNTVNAGKGCNYFVGLARLPRHCQSEEAVGLVDESTKAARSVV